VAEPAVAAPAAAPAPAAAVAFEDDADPAIALLRAKLQEAVRKYQEVEQRIDSANIELDITRTAFKYRYTVLTPAEVPNKPKKPVAMGIGLGALPVALLLAMIIGTAVDLAKGRIVETWQIRRKLKMEVLGELELPG
jgi:hypothetical protein